ncbi:DUF413 domain-containing protein [Photobacterium sp. SDRW27]|uniref:DUF413 domain-containing protein n=1 Tax=Photobacterium obscurum TaxID=2829490 RepID=UPI00224375AD|nr:DUF413 domain-containing protein [Photobacterium obscurum]MCW8328597.1 DUF413 domain-containing protein [Photobacterium obscurum]
MRSEGKFYDDKNFPRGFNRTGVFTISEAMLLEKYGRIMRGLQDGTLEPTSESEHQFLAEVCGQLDVQSDFAKCWLKYKDKTTNKVRSYTLCVSQRRQVNTYEEDDHESGCDNDLDY